MSNIVSVSFLDNEKMLGLGNNDAGSDLAQLRKTKKAKAKKALPNDPAKDGNEEEWTGIIDSS